MENAVNEENKIVEQPVTGFVFDDEDGANGVGEKTVTGLVVVPVTDQNYEYNVGNQEVQDLQDSNNGSERQRSDNGFGEPPPSVDLGGCMSPCPSQGTSSSIRNLFNDAERIAER